MKNLVLALALLSTSSPVQAGSVWLIMKDAGSLPNSRFGLVIEKLEMKSMDQCEEQGAIFMSSERLGQRSIKYAGFECLEGK